MSDADLQTWHRFFLGGILRVLILGYGNRDRQDDGVAWHILSELQRTLGLQGINKIQEDFDSESNFVLVFQLQLMPEQAESLKNFDHACFIDAHTGAVQEEVHWKEITPLFQSSPLTHHLTPESLLAVTHSIYNKSPSSVLLSVRGYEFQFSEELSQRTANLVPLAVVMIKDWLEKIQKNMN